MFSGKMLHIVQILVVLVDNCG